jgi:hypothetical protein
MKKVTYFGLLLAVALTGLSSCSSSDDVTSDPTNTKSGESRLTLTISTPVAKTSSAKGNSFAMGSRATDIKSDPGTTAEQTINRITVGIFSHDGSTVRTIQELSSGSGIGKFTQESNSDKATATIVTSSLADKDTILVACNAPTGTFNGVQTAAQFNAKTEDIDNSLATPGGASLVDNNIPMYGSANLEADGENFKAGVNVQHQTAKVTLTSLTVAFDQNGAYKDASFTPTRIFLINVPDDLKFDTDAATGTSKLWQGYDNKDNSSTYKDYLSTSVFSNGTELKGDNTGSSYSFGPTYFFYTMPNKKTDKDGRTKLVIEGTFKSSTTDTKGTIVYYPVPLNANYTNGTAAAADGGKVFAVHANKDYQCTVTIKTKGAPNPTDDVTPQQATINVTVKPFAAATQNTVFE